MHTKNISPARLGDAYFQKSRAFYLWFKNGIGYNIGFVFIIIINLKISKMFKLGENNYEK